MDTRYDELIERLREAARPDHPAPAAMQKYLDTVRLHAYRVTDRDVEDLKAAGLSEDEIFGLFDIRARPKHKGHPA